jgi:L-idonate 5-dehydrogenase
LHYFHHGGFGTVRIQHPMILGHEVAGVITAIGSDVSSHQVGQRVAISPSRPCGVCAYCQAGQHNHCLDMRYYGSAMRNPHIQGAFRQELVIDAHQAHRLADHVSDQEGAMVEPLAVALHAVHRAGSVMGKRVLVTGCGPIGALVVVVARRSGAREIVVTDVGDFTLGKAMQVGADQAINVATDPQALDAFKADKGHFDVMFECSGNQQALRNGLEVLKPRGIIVQVGLCGEMNLPINAIAAKELELRGTFRFHPEFAVGVDWLNKKLIDLKPLISAALPYRDATKAFRLASDRSQAMKVLLNFN